MMLPTTTGTATRFGTARMRDLRRMTETGPARFEFRPLGRIGRRVPARPVPVPATATAK